MCQFYSDSSRFFLPTVKHSKRRRKQTKTHVFSKDRTKFVTGLRHQTERDRRYHAREHILVVLVYHDSNLSMSRKKVSHYEAIVKMCQFYSDSSRFFATNCRD
jgi:hypothetical protein